MLQKSRALLALMLLGALILLSGCGANNQTAPEKTQAVAVPTAASVSAAPNVLDSKLSQPVSQIRKDTEKPLLFCDKILSVMENAACARIPSESLGAFLTAAARAQSADYSDGNYLFAESESGMYSYDKPYADITAGADTSVFFLSEKGESVEKTEFTLCDPLTYVLSGFGGGDFDYASLYTLSASGQGGSSKTVSRLNNQITGWSHFEFFIKDGMLSFADAQLSLSANQTEGPYDWVLCVGRVSDKDAAIMEFPVQTDDLVLPVSYPSVMTLGDAGVTACMNLYAQSAISRIDADQSGVTYKAKGASEQAAFN